MSLLDAFFQVSLGGCGDPVCPFPLQAAFAHLALAFRCDMFTLRRRVQVEERARDVAEENIQQELEQCRVAVQVGRTGQRRFPRAQHALWGVQSPVDGLASC